MILLDTDHFSALKYPESARYEALLTRMDSSPRQEFGITIITVEEQLRGWLALIHKTRNPLRQVPYYNQLAGLCGAFQRWNVVAFDDQAAEEFLRLKRQRISMGTQDMKIAAIALSLNSVCCRPIFVIFGRCPVCESRIGSVDARHDGGGPIHL